MAKGASKISGGGGGAPVQTNAPLTAYEQQEQDLIRGIVADMTRPYDPDNPNNTLTRSDAQAMVEAFAMTHPQANEDQIMDAIDSAVFILNNGTTAPATRTATPATRPQRNTSQYATRVTAPADIMRNPSVNEVSSAMKKNGFDYVASNSFSSLPVGTKVVVSSPIMKSSMSNRRDPDGVHFQTGTFQGVNRFNEPSVKLDSGRTIRVDASMPYESIYVKRRGRG